MNVADLLGLPSLEDDLARLETVLHRSVAAEDPFLAEVATHLISSGGKRLRPALTLAAAACGARLGGGAGLGGGARLGPEAPGGSVAEEVLLGGVSVELVHLASLYHDDVMDEADSRRSVESVNHRWGNLVAIVAGDFLLARAAGIAASLGTEIAGLLAGTLARMCDGQVREVQTTFSPGRSESSYLAAIAGKTASLMATSCRIGALTAGLDRDQVEALTTFGECFGMVFQIRDDILDVVGSDDELGKAAGQDLAKGIYTLPVIRALAEPDVGPELADLLGRPLDPPELDKARATVTASGGIAAATSEARRWADRAAAAAASLEEGTTCDALQGLAYALVDTVPVPSG
ncbi:MAG: polyprenyl synthetase family protein [Acidimicrobiales bacterium]